MLSEALQYEPQSVCQLQSQAQSNVIICLLNQKGLMIHVSLDPFRVQTPKNNYSNKVVIMYFSDIF